MPKIPEIVFHNYKVSGINCSAGYVHVKWPLAILPSWFIVPVLNPALLQASFNQFPFSIDSETIPLYHLKSLLGVLESSW